MIRTLLLASTALLAACTTAGSNTAQTAGAAAPGSTASEAISTASDRAVATAKNAELARFYEAYDQSALSMSPRRYRLPPISTWCRRAGSSSPRAIIPI